VNLGSGERGLLAELCRQSRELLEEEDPSSDPSIARLFPAAYMDDPLRSLEFETNLGAAPRDGKLAAIATLERTVEASELKEEELLVWMGAVNDFRLLLGTRIDISEESTERDYPEGDANHDSFQVYVYLTWLEDRMLRALGEPEAPGSVGGGR
ncbi:MAG: DUF2017 domain-containing protein, partial [Actinomycetota bacterium]|nr:DUF2017 domain-containing protein [Actinomycetota bacterium]